MQLDTPLPEVAHHLPAAAARTLGDCNPVVQELVLTNVRAFVVALENGGVSLAAIDYDVTLGAFVASQVAMAKEATELHWRLQQAYQLSMEVAAMTRMQA